MEEFQNTIIIQYLSIIDISLLWGEALGGRDAGTPTLLNNLGLSHGVGTSSRQERG